MLKEPIPGPDVIGKGKGHRRGATVIAAPGVRIGLADAERETRGEPIALEQGEADGGVPGSSDFGEAVGLALETVQAIAQRPVESLEMDGVGNSAGSPETVRTSTRSRRIRPRTVRISSRLSRAPAHR
jgi:hypothetical protein